MRGAWPAGEQVAFERVDHPRGDHDRVDAEVRQRAMCRLAMAAHPPAQRPLVRRDDAQLGRLADDDAAGLDAIGQQPLGAAETHSLSVTSASSTACGGRSPQVAHAVKACSIATACPLASVAPRPHRRPSRISPVQGVDGHADGRNGIDVRLEQQRRAGGDARQRGTQERVAKGEDLSS